MLQFFAFPYHLGENGGVYHLVGKVKIENFAAIDATKDAAITLIAKYGNYTDEGTLKTPDKTVELKKWTANTTGWVDFTDGAHLELENFETDLLLEFTMNNVKGQFTFADFLIADKTDSIVYSLANDPFFTGVTTFWRKTSTDPDLQWTPFINKENTTLTVQTAATYTYTPNCVLTIDIPENNAEEATATDAPEGNAYTIIDIFNDGRAPFPADKGPYTLRGMIKVENFDINTFHTDRSPNAAFYVENYNAHVFSGDTNGWVPLLKANGQPYTLEAKSGWFASVFGSWAASGKMSLADLAILDKDGNVVYSFETDESLTAGNIAWRTTSNSGVLLMWAWDAGRGTYTYSIADKTTAHTAEDYELMKINEAYTPYVSPDTKPSETTSTTAAADVPATGAALPVASLLLLTGALGLSVLVCKKRS